MLLTIWLWCCACWIIQNAFLNDPKCQKGGFWLFFWVWSVECIILFPCWMFFTKPNRIFRSWPNGITKCWSHCIFLYTPCFNYGVTLCRSRCRFPYANSLLRRPDLVQEPLLYQLCLFKIFKSSVSQSLSRSVSQLQYWRWGCALWHVTVLNVSWGQACNCW